MTLHEVKPSLLQVTVLQGVLASVKLTPNTMAIVFPTNSIVLQAPARTYNATLQRGLLWATD
jgi:hypothetical protein